MHPKFQVPRYYHVLISGQLTEGEEERIRKGITLEDGPAKNVEITFSNNTDLGKSKGSWYHVTVREGRNRLVRRMFEAIEYKVVRLVRFGYGDLRLPQDLPPGEYRQLASEDIQKLRNLVQM